MHPAFVVKANVVKLLIDRVVAPPQGVKTVEEIAQSVVHIGLTGTPNRILCVLIKVAFRS